MNSIKQYLKFVMPYKRKSFWTIIIGILKFAIPLLIPLISKYMSDDLITVEHVSTAENDTQLVWVMGAVFILFLIIRPPIEYLRQYLAQWVGSKVLYDIRDRLFDHIQKLSLRFYSQTKTGEIISRVIHDVEQTKTFV